MRLEKLELSGIGPFEDAVFTIPAPSGAGELVLFEGPNGSGKTTLLEALAVLISGLRTRPSPLGPDENPLVALFEQMNRQRTSSSKVNEIMKGFPYADSSNGTMPPLEYVMTRFRASDVAVRARVVDDGRSAEAALGDASLDWTADADADITGKIDAFAGAARGGQGAVAWAAFAYSAHQPTADLETAGPRDIESPPLEGALSFGTYTPASSLFGQILTNLEFERVKSALYAQESPPSRERDEMARIAEARRVSLARFEAALSRALCRTVKISFPFGQHAPRVTLDGDEIPLENLGEGMRSTAAWLSDLLVRLERIPWVDTARSPLEQDFWLLLDEIDQSLHPTLQASILPALRQLFPNARIYATTHSPFVVASAAEGTVFPIRPGKDHRVRGKVEPQTLEPGQSLEWVVTEIFEAQAGFVDQKTRDMLDAHKRDVRRLQRTGSIDWDAFLARRAELMALNDEVRTVVAMQEVPARVEIDRRLRAPADAQETGSSA